MADILKRHVKKHTKQGQQKQTLKVDEDHSLQVSCDLDVQMEHMANMIS